MEQVEPGEDDQEKPQPQPQQAKQPTAASKVNIRSDYDPVGRYIGTICKQVWSTHASFKIHLSIHRKVLCPFCYRKFMHEAAMKAHVEMDHKNSKVPQYHCKVESCKERFRTQVESFKHFRVSHRLLFRYRCKFCPDCFNTVEELFRHRKTHEPNYLPFEAKWRCSICGEVFDNLNQ